MESEFECYGFPATLLDITDEYSSRIGGSRLVVKTELAF